MESKILKDCIDFTTRSENLNLRTKQISSDAQALLSDVNAYITTILPTLTDEQQAVLFPAYEALGKALLELSGGTLQ